MIVDELATMRSGFSQNLYRCIERILNYNRNSVFVTNGAGQIYNSPYLLVDPAYIQKYRQMFIWPIEQIKDDFRHATHTPGAVYIGPRNQHPAGNLFSNDAEIGEVNI
jgi:hypothetical protein